uniref:Putative WW-binding domain-containing protein n=1 Tax=Fundulus heteroclitus TaxID=8078 RepID=A0A3Q2NTK3_FUNHE
MAKRRAEEAVLLGSPTKRRPFPPLCCVDMPLESVAPAGGVSPPSLLTLLGSRCRKRPHYFDNEEANLCPLISLSGSGKHLFWMLTFFSFLLLLSSFQTAEDSSDEDGTYNSFQYWRVPLPELDLSLLEDASDRRQTKDKAKNNDATSDAMES